MRYLALASDYDETLARHGALAASTARALERFRSTGRKTILVTGREIPDLLSVCDRLDLFDLVIGENGGVLFEPHKGLDSPSIPLSHPASFRLAQDLMDHGVTPLSCGKVVIATLSQHEATVRSAIVRLGLDLRVILNKGSLMILPSGVDKASGLRRALSALGIPSSACWAVGDAENDIEFLLASGQPAAVANALPSVKAKAVFVATHEAGAGVEELIEKILTTDA